MKTFGNSAKAATVALLVMAVPAPALAAEPLAWNGVPTGFERDRFGGGFQDRAMFAGAYVRVPLGAGAKTSRREARAGFALSAVDPRGGWGVAEGGASALDLSFAGDGRARFSAAGQDVGGMAGRFEANESRNRTLKAVGLVAAGLVVVGAVGYAVFAHEVNKNSD